MGKALRVIEVNFFFWWSQLLWRTISSNMQTTYFALIFLLLSVWFSSVWSKVKFLFLSSWTKVLIHIQQFSAPEQSTGRALCRCCKTGKFLQLFHTSNSHILPATSSYIFVVQWRKGLFKSKNIFEWLFSKCLDIYGSHGLQRKWRKKTDMSPYCSCNIQTSGRCPVCLKAAKLTQSFSQNIHCGFPDCSIHVRSVETWLSLRVSFSALLLVWQYCPVLTKLPQSQRCQSLQRQP